MTVSIHNDDLHDLYVSVYDLNTQNSDLLIDQKRLNSDDRVEIYPQKDQNGKFNIRWTVVDTQDASRTKTSEELVGEGSKVDVNLFGI